ncbi:Insulin-like growth factor binding protein, N-terminal [Pseudocohnilembus persalinus]|uniref:Insulin-like growth factor binding protein, N-terminal n=1 Tax=Pseudocohnilembus persalinus TaxID=266149 RepID=A0A0V0Q7A5_PSEPJ|nr:Insulin-like growth factor binding protein, N-terminal [Pseudocohnilembus persalinus]|eukprot:KRW98096.1 Insulin-like growth factor binding protein, N-terminal [Pseudocohnilembus persalinus]
MNPKTCQFYRDIDNNLIKYDIILNYSLVYHSITSGNQIYLNVIGQDDNSSNYQTLLINLGKNLQLQLIKLYQKCPQIKSVCEIGCLQCNSFYDCQQCELGWILDGETCTCAQGYYFNGSTHCFECDYQCIACENSSNDCTICGGNRVYENNCECEDGYYDDGYSLDCQECQFPCGNCISNPYNCLTCAESDPPRISSDCSCPNRYYDDGESPQCQSCLYYCQTCLNDYSCTSCGPNRTGLDFNCINSYYYDDGISIGCQECKETCVKVVYLQKEYYHIVFVQKISMNLAIKMDVNLAQMYVLVVRVKQTVPVVKLDITQQQLIPAMHAIKDVDLWAVKIGIFVLIVLITIIFQIINVLNAQKHVLCVKI